MLSGDLRESIFTLRMACYGAHAHGAHDARARGAQTPPRAAGSYSLTSTWAGDWPG